MRQLISRHCCVVLLFLISVPAIAQEAEAPFALTSHEAAIFNDLYSPGDDVTALIRLIGTDPSSVSNAFLVRLANSWQSAQRDVERISNLQAAQLATISPLGFELAIAARDDSTKDGARIGARLREFYASNTDLFRATVGIEARLKAANMHFLEVNAVLLYALSPEYLRDASRKKTLVGLRAAASKKNSSLRVTAIRAISEMFPNEEIPELYSVPIEGAGFENQVAFDNALLLVKQERWKEFRGILLKHTGRTAENTDPSETLVRIKKRYDEKKSKELSSAGQYINIGEQIGENGESLVYFAHSHPHLENRMDIMELAAKWLSESQQMIREGRKRLAGGEERQSWTRDDLEYEAIALYAEARLCLCMATRATGLPDGQEKAEAIILAEARINRFPWNDIERLSRSRVTGNFSKKDTRQMKMWVRFAREQVVVALARLGQYTDALNRLPKNKSGDYEFGDINNEDKRKILVNNGMEGDVLNDIFRKVGRRRNQNRAAFTRNLETRELMRFMGDRYSGHKVGPFDPSSSVHSVCKLAIDAIDTYENTTGDREYERKRLNEIGVFVLDTLREMLLHLKDQ